jgi:hypothetical protein
MYYYLSHNLKFFAGYLQPSSIFKAKIYRGMHLAYENINLKEKDFIIFSSEYGLIIKYAFHKKNRDLLGPNFRKIYEEYLNEDDRCVFIPNGCEKLNLNEFPYYRKLLLDFAKNLPLDASVLTFSEHDPDFIFLSFRKVPDIDSLDLKVKWEEYLTGGILRKWHLQLNEVHSALNLLSWSERDHFQIENNQVILVAKCNSLVEWKRIQKQLIPSQTEYNLLLLQTEISTSQEALGILQILHEQDLPIDEVIPLIGTKVILLPTEMYQTANTALKKAPELVETEDEVEIFTQISFSEMNSFALAGLIQAPSGHYYSALHLLESSSKRDPITRETFSDDFQIQLKQLQVELAGAFLGDFPPPLFEPELIIDHDCSQTKPDLEFFLEFKSTRICFWRIPDLRDTAYAAITHQAIQVLVSKWSTHALFSGFPPQIGMDLALVFHPIAYSIFQDSNPNDWRSEKIEEISQILQEKITIIASIE